MRAGKSLKYGRVMTVEALAFTAICGIVHSVMGGQPLLIVRVAKPAIIMYTYLYNFAENQPSLGQRLFVAWAGCHRVCMWTVVMLFLMAMFNIAVPLNRFTRFAGVLFGMLITIIFKSCCFCRFEDYMHQDGITHVIATADFFITLRNFISSSCSSTRRSSD